MFLLLFIKSFSALTGTKPGDDLVEKGWKMVGDGRWVGKVGKVGGIVGEELVGELELEWWEMVGDGLVGQ